MWRISDMWRILDFLLYITQQLWSFVDIFKMRWNIHMPIRYVLNISERHTDTPQRMQIALYISDNMCRNMPFKIYTKNKYMWALSLAIVSISISIAIGDGTETRSKAVLPAIGSIWGNVPVPGSLSDIRRQPCESVANHPLPCEFYSFKLFQSFKLFKISTSDFGNVSICAGHFAHAHINFLLR